MWEAEETQGIVLNKYMLSGGCRMARIDDYKEALRLARGFLAEKNPDLVASFSGSTIQRNAKGDTSLSLRFLNRDIVISWPQLLLREKQSREQLPVQEQILLLHYLQGAWSASGPGPEGEWIAFQEVPDGRFYLDAFNRRAKNPMVKAFGEEPERIVSLAAQAFGGVSFDHGDFSVLIQALPLIPVVLVLWKGDEEFPPEGNILFDRSVPKILSAEDIAWLSGMVVYPLIGMARGDGP
ncbi:MAG: hypothetical protein DRH11_01635 [Deltaproteobacteria bacterium]|nr:MAG: hypothetical protein DRH11_01635 [Deltaproteobacteria bacterium]